MDLGDFNRRFTAGPAARPDYGMLLASLGAHQATSAAAHAASAGEPRASTPNPLIELLIAGPRWREAAAALCGSFHPGAAAHLRHRSSTEMTGVFTFAF